MLSIPQKKRILSKGCERLKRKILSSFEEVSVYITSFNLRNSFLFGKRVNRDQIIEFIGKTKKSAADPLVYQKIFTLIAKERKKAATKDSEALLRIFGEEYDDLTRRLDKTGLQDSVNVRNVLRTRDLSNYCVDDQGEIQTKTITHLLPRFSEMLYSTGPKRQHDVVRQEHILKILKLIVHDKEISLLMKQVSKPYLNPAADQIIRDTLRLPSSTVVTDAHARRAVLAALMCYPRQSVGSCFGTAPAIMIHNEEPAQFLKDIIELLGTGRLKRIFGGVEYSVPLCSSWGIGDLRKRVVVSSESEPERMEMGLQPGIIEAFAACGLIKEASPLKERILLTQKTLADVVNKTFEPQPQIVTTAEKMIEAALLSFCGVTEKEVYDYDHRPQEMVFGELLIPQATSLSEKGRGKTNQIAKFKQLFEIGKSAFKSLADNALLKTWEFTLSSFAENKSGFTNWNLYASLGLSPQDKGGIGATIFEMIKHKLDEANDKVKEIQDEYEQVLGQVRYFETRMRTATTEKELEWIKVEYQSKANEFRFLEELRNKNHQKALRFSNLFDLLIDIYLYLFPKYFQEVYDPDMHDVESGPYDDSPAGFRLLYKHGRGNTAQWSRIYTPKEFIDSLVSFFTATENEIKNTAELEGFEDEFSAIVTAVVIQIRTQEFLETSFYRMALAHHTPLVKNPLENLDKIDKKPWAYVSGGTMNTLVGTYFRREQKITEVARWVESSMELLVFLVDTVKQMPGKTQEAFLAYPLKNLLMHSPTHAFLFRPGYQNFRRAWQNEAFTYTWIRDQVLLPIQRFVENIRLTDEMMAVIIQELAKEIPDHFKFYFNKVFEQLYGSMTPMELREYILEKISMEKSLQMVLSSEDVDSKLYEMLPLFPAYQLKERVETLLAELPQGKQAIQSELVDSVIDLYGRGGVYAANQLQDICKTILSLYEMKTSLGYDMHAIIAEAAQKLGYAMPRPILFADSNWVRDYFGFTVNPGTGEFDLWRLDCNGTSGSPMKAWRKWLNGSNRDRTWGIYNRLYEYQA